MENLRSPFENIFNIIGGLPQGHEKPLKHALYNAVALLFLFLCCAAAWALYIILEPFIKPLIWALLVGSVLHPLKYSLATKFRSWFDKLDESHTPIILGVLGLPINIINDLSEFIGGKLLNHIKIIVAVVIAVPAIHIIYYYTPRLCVCIAWKLWTYTYMTVNWLIAISTTSAIIVVLIGYISILALWWKPSTVKHFRLASLGIWIFISCYIAHLAGNFQVTIFITLQLISFGGFIYEVSNIHDEMQDSGKHITYVESALWVLENKTSKESISEVKENIGNTVENETTKPETNVTTPAEEQTAKLKTEKDDIWNLELFESKAKGDSQTKNVLNLPNVTKSRNILKPQRSLSHPSPMSRLTRIPPSLLDRSRRLSLKAQTIMNTESLASDTYLYILLWACGALIFWKNITLLPLLPLPIIIYVLKHVGIYLGLWQWIGSQFALLGNTIYQWCVVRYDALVPAPIRGLYKIILKINSSIKDGVRDSIDTVSSILVILGLIVFMICASIFFAIQIYAEAIMLVQTTGNVINSTVVHNPELRQLLPPSLDETLDSILDNAYMYGREGISKLIRGMMSDVDSIKSAKLEQQVLELWDRVYQAWMSSNNNPGPQVTTDAVQNSWEAFLDDIKKSPEMFNIQGITEFVKQNIGTFMSVLESLWSILKGNLTILVGSFSALVSILLGGGTAVLNFVLNVIVFLTTLFYLLSSSGNLYKPVDLITNFSPYNGNRFGVALEGAVNGVFKASFKMAVFYGLWTWFIHTLFGVKIVYLSSALATVLGAVPFLGTYWACVPAVLDLWLAQSCGFKAILLAICQFLPSMVVDTSIYKEIKGGHPYLTGLAIAGGIFCIGFEGAIIGPLLLCGLYVVIDLSSSLFKESPTEEVAASLQMQQHLSRLNMMFEQ